jgi:hypothetical protein
VGSSSIDLGRETWAAPQLRRVRRVEEVSSGVGLKAHSRTIGFDKVAA